MNAENMYKFEILQWIFRIAASPHDKRSERLREVIFMFSVLLFFNLFPDSVFISEQHFVTLPFTTIATR